MKRKLIRPRLLMELILSILGLCNVLNTQAAMPPRLYFDHYNDRNGLSSNSVSYIMQDGQGFIWVATKDGLNRFDGFNFRLVDTGDRETCSYGTTIHEDKDGKIWVGAHNGAFIYDPSTEQIRKVTIPRDNGLSVTQPVVQFLNDPDDNILMLVDSDGVYRYKEGNDCLETLYSSPSIKVNQAVYDPTGRVWVGTFGQGLFFSDDNFHTLNRFSISGNDDFNTSIISDLKMKGDKLYVATERFGVVAVDVATRDVTNVFTENTPGHSTYVRQLLFDPQGTLYIATENGVYIHDIQKGKIVNHLTHNIFDRYSISDNAIYALLCDREGGIWVGSYFGGIDYADMRCMKFDKYYPDNSPGSLPGQRIRELCEDPVSGLIYVGSEDHGISCFHPDSGLFTSVEGIQSNNVHALCIDGRRLWVGTFAHGLKAKNLDSGAVRNYSTADGLVNDYIFVAKRTLHGELLIGTMAGLQTYDRPTDSFRSIPEFANIFIYDILEDRKGNLWVATYDHGLYMRPAARANWTHFQWDSSDQGSIPSDKVYGIYEDTEGTIWVMTQDGLCTYNAGNSTFGRDLLGINRIQGMVYQVIDDDYGRLWLTTNHGLYCLDRKSGNLRRFSDQGGLPTNQFNYRSSLKAADGRIYLGTIEGLVAFQPVGFNFASKPMKPVIAELYLHGMRITPEIENSPLLTTISKTGSLNLESHQNSLAFKIVSLQYSSQGEQGVRYKLEGFDHDWHHVPLNEAMLSYPNLDYGNYTLKVASYDEFSNNADEIVELKIKIATPAYLTWWAITIYILLAVVIIYVIFYLYRRNSQLKNQRYLENYTVEKEREAYDSKINFFTNVAHEIRTPLTLIKAPLDCVSKSPAFLTDPEIRENMDVINLNVDRLLLLANQLLDFRKMEDGKFQIRKQQADITSILKECLNRFRPTIESAGKSLTVTLPETPVTAYVDSEAITKIISNMITNAIKYGKTYIDIRLEQTPDNFSIVIANDGDVVAPEKREEIFTLFSRLTAVRNVPGTGIGLAYARSLAQMHSGTLTMSDATDKNEFILSVPIESGEEVAQAEEATTSDLEKMIQKNSQSVTILVVDDNIEMLNFLEKKLMGCGFRVIKANDGRDALNVLATEYVDIVVSDIMMPEIDGMELLQRIKSDVNFSHIPVILLTAKTRLEDKLSGLDSGADAYVEKPFAIEYLVGNINMLLRNRERIRQRLERMPITKVAGKGLSKVDEEFLQKINDIIQANFHNSEFSMEDVIASMGMSRTSFYRKIKGMLDLNPNEYIKIERLKKARQLFEEGHTSVSEVCYMVGFASPGYFTKCFQKQFEISPKEFIARQGKKTTASPE